MDSTNLDILKLLEEKGRSTHEEIAKQLHLSRPAIHERVHKLERENIIKGYRGIINWRKLGQSIKAFIYIKTSGVDCKEIASRYTDLKVEDVVIEECHRLAGEWCIALKVRSKTPEDIANLIDTLRSIPGTVETTTTFILSTVFENGIKEHL